MRIVNALYRSPGWRLAGVVASLTFGRRLVFVIIRWANDNFRSEVPVITAILVIMGTMALITHAIGVHTVLGAFVAGILVGQSPILTTHIDEQLRGLIAALFAPVFFGPAGLGADLTILNNLDLGLLTLGLILIASVGKFSGAFIGGWCGGLTSRESLAIACGMNAHGSTEVIVASIGLAIGALTQNLYTVIVTMAVATTMAMPPMLRWGLGRLPMREDERVRLEREAQETEGFVAQLERLLVAVDGSPKGRFASRLAGLIAGARGMPITVLAIDSAAEAASADASPEEVSSAVREAASSVPPRDPETDRDGADVDVGRASAAPEARRGGRGRGREGT